MENHSLDNITMAEVEQFLSEYSGPDYYIVDFDILQRGAIYIKAYRDGEKLMGIAGVYRKYGVTGHFIIINLEYQGKGIGFHALGDMVEWGKRHKLPFMIAQYWQETLESRKKQLGFKSFTKIGPWSYAFLPITSWAWLIVPVFPIIARIFHVIRYGRLWRSET